MGKEDLLEALVTVQTATSVADLRAQFIVIHQAFRGIHRKRWKFLEDTCFHVVRNVFCLLGLKNNDKIKSQECLNDQALDLSLEFLEPLIDATMLIVEALDDEQEAANQRGVLIAALLYLLTKATKRKESPSRLVVNVLKCGVDMHVLFSTLRFREEVAQCQRVLLPSQGSDSEDSVDLNEAEKEEEGDLLKETVELKSDDLWWITEQVAKKWGLTHYQYFLAITGQEYAFAAWSCSGIANFMHTLLTEERFENALSAVVSPLSWLFLVASFAHSMIIATCQQERFRGLEVLRAAIDLCPQGKLTIQRCDAPIGEAQSFREQEALFRERNWISPLIQAQTSAMISFREATHRSAALSVLKAFVLVLVDADRFWILRDMIVECPYGNVGAILVDFVRNDTVQAWSSSDTKLQSPCKTSAICSLLYETLIRSVQRDLTLQADLIASCLSLLRFLYIRDKDNITEIRGNAFDRDFSLVLIRMNKRLQLMLQESTSGAESESVKKDFSHLIVLEASLVSTLELYKSGSALNFDETEGDLNMKRSRVEY